MTIRCDAVYTLTFDEWAAAVLHRASGPVNGCFDWSEDALASAFAKLPPAAHETHAGALVIRWSVLLEPIEHLFDHDQVRCVVRFVLCVLADSAADELAQQRDTPDGRALRLVRTVANLNAAQALAEAGRQGALIDDG